MSSKSQRFTAEVLQQGPNPYVVVPVEVSEAFAPLAEGSRVRVRGTLEGMEIRGNLVPRKAGQWLFLHTGMRAAAQAKTGDRVELVLRASFEASLSRRR